MILGEVAGRVYGAVHAASLRGIRLLEVRPVRLGGESPAGGEPSAGGVPSAVIVAADALGAGPGEHVLVAHGTRVRDLTLGVDVAVKDVVVAIVDGWDAGTR